MGFDERIGQPVRVGLVGTGFVAKVRAAAFNADDRAQVVAVSGHRVETAHTFAQTHTIPTVCPTWQDLVAHAAVDLVVVCNLNCDHGPVVHAALMAGKAVVVEYPLALCPDEAQRAIALAQQQNLLLHVEHIELLGGLHQAMMAHLPQVGTPHYVRYATAVPQNPVPQKWTFCVEQFGFPLVAALSRVHRLTNLFGAVDEVFCQLQYDDRAAADFTGYFKQCRCTAQLRFANGVIAEVLYAKGEQTWRSQRWMEVEGDRGALTFDREAGTLITTAGEMPIEVGSRRGLFAQDTASVLDTLLEGKPLYVTLAESLYALQVATAAATSAQTGRSVRVEAPYPKLVSR